MTVEAKPRSHEPVSLDIVAARAPLRILAYVHLRNIYASTGAGRTARQIIEHLEQRPDVALKVLADSSDKRHILPLVREPWTSYEYRVFNAETSRQQARWFLTNSPKAENYWPEADIVFCTGESYVPAERAKLVVTTHDASFFEQGGLVRNAAYWKVRIKWELLYKKLDRKADMFHTVSEFSRERLGHFFPSLKSRIRVVHNGVTPHFFGPVADSGKDFVAQAGLQDRPFILVPGGLHFRKNAELILSASPYLLAQYPDLMIAVVNHNDSQYTARALSIGSRFLLLGFVTDEALHALYAAATIVWFPSRYEGFGLPVVEAMASGTCVVASNSSSIPEIAGQAAVLADPLNESAHIAAIESLLTDERARTEFALRGRTRASRFTWATTAEQLRLHFESLV